MCALPTLEEEKSSWEKYVSKDRSLSCEHMSPDGS